MNEKIAIELDYSTAAKCGHTQDERESMLVFILAEGANNLEAAHASPEPFLLGAGANNPEEPAQR